MSAEIFWVYVLAVKDGALDDFRTLAREIGDKTRLEEGAIAYSVSESDDGRTVHVVEHYRDSAAVVAHVRNTFEPVADRMKALTDAKGVTVYGDPEPAARAITDSWGAAYMTPTSGFLHRG